jgi:hypothetical protein
LVFGFTEKQLFREGAFSDWSKNGKASRPLQLLHKQSQLNLSPYWRVCRMRKHTGDKLLQFSLVISIANVVFYAPKKCCSLPKKQTPHPLHVLIKREGSFFYSLLGYKKDALV